MRVGLVVSDPKDWTARSLARALKDLRAELTVLDFSGISVYTGKELSFIRQGVNLGRLDALLIRDLGRGPPQEVAFKFQLLQSLVEQGLGIINAPQSIIRAANKMATSVALENAGVPTPRTTVTNSPEDALTALEEYGDAVSKPLFGYKGKGILRLGPGDEDKLLEMLKRAGVVYLQEFVPTAMNRDIRAFVVGDEVLGAIYRNAPPGSWISNLARGGREEACSLTADLEEVALAAAWSVGTVYCGVDLLESEQGLKVIEVNGTPSGKGIYSALGVDVGPAIARRVLDLAKN